MTEDVARLRRLNEELRYVVSSLFHHFSIAEFRRECVIEVADNSKLKGEFRLIISKYL